METCASSASAPQPGCDPRSLSAADLEDEITALSASMAVATWRLLMLIAELDRRNAWQQWRERDGVDRDFDSAATEPDGTADVSAETSNAFAPSSNSFDNAESPVAARRADALSHIAGQFLAHEAVSSRQAGRYQVVVHVDRSVLSEQGHGDCCHIEHGGAIAAETARRLVCDASVVMLEEGGDGELLNIGRRSRVIPPAIRRALAHRDKGCRFPGCLNHLYVDAHHVRHWADGGETRIDNLVLLCRHHHGLLHEGGFTLQRRDDGKLLFFRPDGELLPEVPKPPLRVRDIEAIVAETGADVSAETSRSLWDGSAMDLDMAVGGLMILNGWEARHHPWR